MNDNSFFDQIINGPTPSSVLTFAIIGVLFVGVAASLAVYEIASRITRAREARDARLREERAAAMRRHPSGRRLREAAMADATVELPQWLNDARLRG